MYYLDLLIDLQLSMQNDYSDVLVLLYIVAHVYCFKCGEQFD
jgi:hypothetical protein